MQSNTNKSDEIIVSQAHTTERRSRNQRIQKLLLYIVCFIFLYLTAALTYQHIKYKQNIYDKKRSALVQLTKNAATEISKEVAEVVISANNLADKLLNDQDEDTDPGVYLEEMLAEKAHFYSGAITYKPYEYLNEKLHAQYYARRDSKATLTYDYNEDTNPLTEWFTNPMLGKTNWSGPYWDEDGETFVVTYSVLFYASNEDKKKALPAGVVTLDVSINQIRKKVEALDLGPSGFPALTALDGKYIYHPYNELAYVRESKTLVDVAKEKDDPDRLKLAIHVANQEDGLIEHFSTSKQKESWLIYEPIAESGWSLQNTFIIDDIPINPNQFRQQLFEIIISFVCFALFFVMLLLKAYKSSSRVIYALSGSISLIFASSIAAIWNIALQYSETGLDYEKKISNIHSVVKEKEQFKADKYYDSANSLFIKTGLQIEFLELLPSNNVSVSGYIWLRYPETMGIEINEKSLIFAHAKTNRLALISEYEEKTGLTYKLFSFQSIVRSDIDQSKYPLEYEHIELTLISTDADQNIYFVPDISRYLNKTPADKPGLSRTLIVPGWELIEAYFTFQEKTRNSNLGVAYDTDKNRFPALSYKIGIKRIFIDAFISNLTPLIVVSIVLFALVLLPTSIDISKTLGTCVSMFFVVVFAHLAIRRNISIGEIFYIEYFYFVIYIFILFVPINSFRIALDIKSAFFDYKEGLLFKAIYWPLSLLTSFIITTLKFY